MIGDLPSAVSYFAEACELLAAQFGYAAKECGESYYYYGKSLLELSRLESEVLENALEGVPAENDENSVSCQFEAEDPEKLSTDEKSKVQVKVAEALDYNFMTNEIVREEAEMENAESESDEDAEVDESHEKIESDAIYLRRREERGQFPDEGIEGFWKKRGGGRG